MMRPISQAIANIAEPIVRSKSFQRLYDISFLGILSPRFGRLPDHPLSFKRKATPLRTLDDESRAHHSIEVANIMLNFCEPYSSSEPTRKYAVAWALLHDIATWPLSHTSEAAFTSIIGLTHQALRRKMVLGDPSLPKDYSMEGAIREMGISHVQMMSLFDKNIRPQDPDLGFLHSFIHSPITPDTLEGIHRSGRALGIAVSSPSAVLASFERDMLDTMILNKHSRPVLKFMRQKREIYETYLNTQYAIKYESRWTDAIKDLFGSITLVASLELREDEMVKGVCQSGLPEFQSIGRYKPPRRYIIDESLSNKRTLQKDRKLEDLGQLFHSERK